MYSDTDLTPVLLGYRQENIVTPCFAFEFLHPEHKTGNIWHCRIPMDALNGATYYAYRIDGPRAPEQGHRFDAQKILLDPYAPEVFFPPGFSRHACDQHKRGRPHGDPLARAQLDPNRAQLAEEFDKVLVHSKST